MSAIALYLINVIACSGLLTGYYWLALRNKIFHQWNRFYLLACVVLSLVAPLLNISIGSSHAPAPNTVLWMLDVVTKEGVVEVKSNGSSGLLLTARQWTWLLYMLVSTLLLSMVAASGFRIYNIIRTYPKTKLDNICFLNTDVRGTPFSFFHYIVWNRVIDLTSEDGQRIFRHELVHVQQRHTWDKIFLLLLLVAFWINPFFWLIRKELAALHEFTADQRALDIKDTAALAQMILNTAFPQQHFLFTNHLFQSTIKRRIAMFTKLQNPKVTYLGHAIALPVILITLAAFAVKTKQSNLKQASHVLIKESKKQPENSRSILGTGDTVPEMHLKGNRLFYEGRELVGFIPNDGGKEVILLYKDRTKKLLNAEHGVAIIDEDGDMQLLPQNTQYFTIEIHITSVKNAAQFKGPIKLNDRPFKGTWQDLPFTKEEIDLVAFTLGEGIEIWFGLVPGDSVLSVYTKSYFNKQKTKSDRTKLEPQVILSDTSPIKDMIVRKATVKETKNFKGIIVLDEKRFDGGWNQLPHIEIAYMQFVKGTEIAKEYGIKPDVEILSIVTNAFSERLRRERDPATKPIFTESEVEPMFPEANGGWKVFLQKNLNATVPVTNGVKPGTYKVIVQFIVDENGKLSDIKPLTSLGYGMEEEVVRLMRLSPDWIPATQNGKKVSAYKKQTVTFVISES